MGRNPISHSLQDLNRLIKKSKEYHYFIYFEDEPGKNGYPVGKGHRQGLSRMAYEQRLSYEIKGLVTWIQQDE